MGVSGQVALSLTCLDRPPAEVGRLAALLADDERDRAGRYARACDARRFIVRRGRLRQWLGAALDAPPSALRLVAGEHGRLSVADAQLSFNLSHSGGWALFAASRGFEVGCDLEWRRDELATPAVAARFFSEGEQAALAKVPAGRWSEAFFNAWTRKEALIKGLGLGVSYPLDSFDVSLTPGAPAALLKGPPGWSLRAFEPAPGLHAALALRARCDQAEPPDR